MTRHPLLATFLALPTLLGGCATVRFSTPAINGATLLSSDGKCPAKPRTGEQFQINRDVIGALNLIENYRVGYDCALRDLSNGRQLFQVPSALLLAGGAAAAAFGAGASVAIATGAGGATLNQGDSYYAPKAKAHIMSAAYNAVVCIKQEASGITAMNVAAAQPPPAVNTKGVDFQSAPVPRISFEPELQFYQLVFAALENVSSILGERLSSIGSYSPDSLAKEITQLAAEQAKAQSDAAKKDARTQAKAFGEQGLSEDAIVSGIVELAGLQSRLRLCIITAKAG